mmetsp:Transcript_82670/g.200393  ORF Transcript_82670/g.200393 Transcript_82670/m.200393 type:complete len:277 (-) Transcript_82670:65-895(-)
MEYQLQSLGHTPRRCRQQEVSVLVHATPKNGSQHDLHESRLFTGIASSLGTPVPTLPLVTDNAWGSTREEGRGPVFISDAKGITTMEGGLSITNQTAMPGHTAQTGSSREDAFLASLQDELGLPRLDLERAPGQMPPFSFAAARHARSRELFATRNVVIANPVNACSSLLEENGHGDDAGRYAGRIAVVSRGSCLFLQKLRTLQQARVAGAVVVNHEGESQELQVMTCPLAERGAGNDVHIPAVMVSHKDGVALMELVESHRIRGGSVTACMFAQH